jgi:hypothetical protein
MDDLSANEQWARNVAHKQNDAPEQGISREKAFELASEAERPILEILLRGGSPIRTNRAMLQAAKEVTTAIAEAAVCDCHTWPTISEMHEYVVALETKLRGHGSCVTYEQLSLAIDKHRNEAIAEAEARVWKRAIEIVANLPPPTVTTNTFSDCQNSALERLEAAKAGKK